MKLKLALVALSLALSSTVLADTTLPPPPDSPRAPPYVQIKLNGGSAKSTSPDSSVSAFLRFFTGDFFRAHH